MTGFLLDTNCISEVVRLKPDPRVMAWIEAVEESLLYLSVLTMGEIRKGLAALPQGKRRSRLETWLEVELQARFSGRILSIDAAVADPLQAQHANAGTGAQLLGVSEGGGLGQRQVAALLKIVQGAAAGGEVGG